MALLLFGTIEGTHLMEDS